MYAAYEAVRSPYQPNVYDGLHRADPQYQQGGENYYAAAAYISGPQEQLVNRHYTPLGHRNPGDNPHSQNAIHHGDLMHVHVPNELVNSLIDACSNAAELLNYSSDLTIQGVESINRANMILELHTHYMNPVVHTDQEMHDMYQQGINLLSQSYWYTDQARIIVTQAIGNITHALGLDAGGRLEGYQNEGQEGSPDVGYIHDVADASEADASEHQGDVAVTHGNVGRDNEDHQSTEAIHHNQS